MTRIKILVITLLLSVTGMTQLSDQGLWISSEIEKELPGPYTIGLTPEVRLGQGMTRWNSILMDASFNYKATKWMKVSFVFRHSWRQGLDDHIGTRQRANIDVVFDKSFRDIKWSYRFRAQTGLNDALSEGERDFRQAFRHRFKARKKLMKKTWLDLGYEFFFANSSEGFNWTDGRFKATIKRKVKKRQYASVGYLYQNEWNTKYPLREHVLTLSYSYTFK